MDEDDVDPEPENEPVDHWLDLFESLRAEPEIDGPWDPVTPLWRSRARPVGLTALHRLVPGAEELDLLEEVAAESSAREVERECHWMTWPAAPAGPQRPGPEHPEADDWPGAADWQDSPGVDRPHLHIEVVEGCRATPRQAVGLVLRVLGGTILRLSAKRELTCCSSH